MVHLHAKGHSRRGPSFSVPLHTIYQMHCEPMFSHCTAEEIEESNRTEGRARVYDIFIPAPENCMREQAYSWHATTRNFFAFLFGKPLVGTHLGKALVDLHERLQLFRTCDVDNCEDMIAYMEGVGYLNFSHNMDHALAALFYAETFKLRDLWIDAFTHCVGMYGVLSASPEFEVSDCSLLPACGTADTYKLISHHTNLSITRASLEMGLRLDRVSKSLSNFLENELSASHVGFDSGARAHLDRFRTFLHQYHVEKFGYWPPIDGSQYPTALYKSMYFDFRGLYDYLVDKDSSESKLSERLPSGGICVLQNIQAFNRRHNYSPLFHPQPLIPNASTYNKAQTQRALLALSLGSRNSKNGRQFSARTALCAAANTMDLNILDCPLVKAYRTFERDSTLQKTEKVSLQDARKVRWILIYAILQVLISATRAPSEVRNSEDPRYPLCVSVSGIVPWLPYSCEASVSRSTPPSRPLSASPSTTFHGPRLLSNSSPSLGDRSCGSDSVDINGMPVPTTDTNNLPPTEPHLEIHPDCETDSNYFGKSRSNSAQSLSSMATPADASKTATSSTSSLPAPLVRRQSSSKRAIKALSFAIPSRRNSITVKSPPSSFCEIIVKGYGNGLNQPTTSVEPLTTKPQPTLVDPSTSAISIPNSQSVSKFSSSDEPPIKTAPQKLPKATTALKRHTFHVPERLGNPDSNALPVPLHSPRTPTLDLAQFDRSFDAAQNLHADYSDVTRRRSNSNTPLSTSTGTDSDEETSPVWSSRRSSASSQSSTEMVPRVSQQPEPAELPEHVVPARPVELPTSKAEAELVDPGPLQHYKYQDENDGCSSTAGQEPPSVDDVPEIHDVGGLLGKMHSASETASRPNGILVHRSFSVEHIHQSEQSKLDEAPIQPVTIDTATTRREQERKLKERMKAQSKLKKKNASASARHEPRADIDAASILRREQFL